MKLGSVVRLDDLYKMTSFIYSDTNLSRPASATFGHFVEVCGMLTIHVRRRKREGLSVTDALCKALGWYPAVSADRQSRHHDPHTHLQPAAAVPLPDASLPPAAAYALDRQMAGLSKRQVITLRVSSRNPQETCTRGL